MRPPELSPAWLYAPQLCQLAAALLVWCRLTACRGAYAVPCCRPGGIHGPHLAYGCSPLRPCAAAAARRENKCGLQGPRCADWAQFLWFFMAPCWPLLGCAAGTTCWHQHTARSFPCHQVPFVSAAVAATRIRECFPALQAAPRLPTTCLRLASPSAGRCGCGWRRCRRTASCSAKSCEQLSHPSWLGSPAPHVLCAPQRCVSLCTAPHPGASASCPPAVARWRQQAA